MQITKPQIQLQINKTELNQLIADALSNPESAAAIKRVLNPQLANSFPQFPGFSNITLGDTDESGATTVILKQPKVVEKQVESAEPEETEPEGPIKSLEPEIIEDPTESSDETVSEPYVDPESAE